MGTHIDKRLAEDLLEALEWMEALFEAGDFRADHKAEALTIRRKTRVVIRRAKKALGSTQPGATASAL